MTAKTFIALVIGFMLGFMVAGALQEMIQAGARSKAMRTLADARTIAAALEDYRRAHGRYPPLNDGIAGLQPYLVPAYLRAFPTRDVYGHPYLLLMHGSRVLVVSTGKDGCAMTGGDP
jgi:type II secretory pathway pseudopilin PulG